MPRCRRRAKALPKWSAASGYQRAKVLYAIGRAMQRHQRLFAVLESIDNGKPIRESRDIDVPLAIRHFIHHAGWAQALDREFPGHKPAGVVGQIIPWNFPLLMLAWKIAPALAAGCTVVLKPAEFTPLTAILFAEICERAGVPKGVVNIVPGGPEAGAAIVNHPGVAEDRLHRLVGGRQDHPQGDRRLRQEAVAGTRRQVGLHRLRGRRSRQRRRRAGRRHLVQPGPGLLRRLAPPGAGRHRRRLHRQGQDAHEPAARRQPARQEHRYRPAGRLAPSSTACAAWSPKAPGRAPNAGSRTVALPSSGYFHLPTLATGVAPANILAQEEVFGPVLATMTFRNTEEAVELANNTRYGLAASVWSENLNVALHVAPQLKAGVVWVNGTNMFDAACGFGGYRESGFGREGGREGMFEYLAANAAARRRRSSLPRPRRAVAELAEGAGAASTAPQSCSSAASRRGRTATIPIAVLDRKGSVAGEVGLGNRKDIRDAVSAARACKAWPEATAYNRSQVLYYLAENLSARADEFAARLVALTGAAAKAARAGGRSVGRAAVPLCRHGRQVRGQRPSAAGPRRDAGAARAGRRDRHRRAGRGAAAWA